MDSKDDTSKQEPEWEEAAAMALALPGPSTSTPDPQLALSITLNESDYCTLNCDQCQTIIQQNISTAETWTHETSLLEEKEKCEELLYRLLPISVAEQLMQGKAVEPELFEETTIFFSDIVGFTAMCSRCTPMEVITLLDDLYTSFDKVLAKFDVYKVETVGDAYMAVSGLPNRNGVHHAIEIARLALILRRVAHQKHVPHKNGQRIQIRIGIHSGPCVGGIVGQIMPRYCLFGDTVNTASRLESSGMPQCIHISAQTKALLDRYKQFVFQFRGYSNIKGKGLMESYFLLGKDRSHVFYRGKGPPDTQSKDLVLSDIDEE